MYWQAFIICSRIVNFNIGPNAIFEISFSPNKNKTPGTNHALNQVLDRIELYQTHASHAICIGKLLLYVAVLSISILDPMRFLGISFIPNRNKTPGTNHALNQVLDRIELYQIHASQAICIGKLLLYVAALSISILDPMLFLGISFIPNRNKTPGTNHALDRIELYQIHASQAISIGKLLLHVAAWSISILDPMRFLRYPLFPIKIRLRVQIML